mmetsp:Transcript_3500/g.3856  ORF Transcript_3500/g.3856 Transcript_3500/m.3856 type:complete len:89 (+) Transcript_3500:20-286(+)
MHTREAKKKTIDTMKRRRGVSDAKARRPTSPRFQELRRSKSVPKISVKAKKRCPSACLDKPPKEDPQMVGGKGGNMQDAGTYMMAIGT